MATSSGVYHSLSTLQRRCKSRVVPALESELLNIIYSNEVYSFI